MNFKLNPCINMKNHQAFYSINSIALWRLSSLQCISTGKLWIMTLCFSPTESNFNPWRQWVSCIYYLEWHCWSSGTIYIKRRPWAIPKLGDAHAVRASTTLWTRPPLLQVLLFPCKGKKRTFLSENELKLIDKKESK